MDISAPLKSNRLNKNVFFFHFLLLISKLLPKQTRTVFILKRMLYFPRERQRKKEREKKKEREREKGEREN